jgi:hypothetical protein
MWYNGVDREGIKGSDGSDEIPRRYPKKISRRYIRKAFPRYP